MNGYTQLTRKQRSQIQALRHTGQIQLHIATVVGVHKTTISRELRRNRGLRGLSASPSPSPGLSLAGHQAAPSFRPDNLATGGDVAAAGLESRTDSWPALARTWPDAQS